MTKLDKKKQSQLDLGGVLRSAHEDKNQSLRVTSANTSVPPSYSRVDLTYNGQVSITNAKFYEGTFAEIREVRTTDDTAGSLNNTYFTLFSEYDESLYHVWYNVDGLGVNPAPIGSCGIEVQIQSNDDKEIVALATKLAIDFIEDFKADRSVNIVKITNIRKGTSSNLTDVGTGFAISTLQEGTEELIKNIDIPFDGNVRYIYNEQERRFEIEAIASLGTVSVDIDADNGDNISISRHEKYREILDDVDILATGLDVDLYSQVLSYVSVEDLRVRVIKIKCDTFGSFKLKVNGVIKDYFNVSAYERNCKFQFIEDLDVLTGDSITIEFLPDRVRLTSYNFFLRIEGYVK